MPVKSTLALSLLMLTCFAPLARAAEPQRYVDIVLSDVTVVKDVVYGRSTPYTDAAQTTPGPLTDYKMDIYSPKGDTATKRPAIVMVHGGGFIGGNKEHPNQIFLAKEFARRGYVAALIDYRLMPPEGKEQYLPVLSANAHAAEDLYGAVRFLRVHAEKYGIDSGRIGVEGHSAGGAVALLGAFQRDKALCENNGGLDANGKPLASSDFSTAVAIGAAWPLGISKDARPVKVIVGGKDGSGIHKPLKLLNNQTPLQLMQQQAAGVMDLDLTIVPEKGHEFYPAYKDRVIELMVPWYKTHLIDAPRVGDGPTPTTAEARSDKKAGM
jgi:dienelactone hydrolase